MHRLAKHGGLGSGGVNLQRPPRGDSVFKPRSATFKYSRRNDTAEARQQHWGGSPACQGRSTRVRRSTQPARSIPFALDDAVRARCEVTSNALVATEGPGRAKPYFHFDMYDQVERHGDDARVEERRGAGRASARSSTRGACTRTRSSARIRQGGA